MLNVKSNSYTVNKGVDRNHLDEDTIENDEQ